MKKQTSLMSFLTPVTPIASKAALPPDKQGPALISPLTARTPRETMLADLQKLGLRLIDIAPDNNCYFRCWAFVVHGDVERHQEMRDRERSHILSNLEDSELLRRFRAEFPLKTFKGPEYASLKSYASYIATPSRWGGDFDNWVLLTATGIARVEMLVVHADGTIFPPYDSAIGEDALARILRLVFHPTHCDLAVPIEAPQPPQQNSPAAAEPEMPLQTFLLEAEDGDSSSEEEEEGVSSEEEEEDSFFEEEEEGTSSEEEEGSDDVTLGGHFVGVKIYFLLSPSL